MKNEIKVTRFLEDTSPLRSNLKGEVVKDIDRDKKPQGTKKNYQNKLYKGKFLLISFELDMLLLKSTQELNW